MQGDRVEKYPRYRLRDSDTALTEVTIRFVTFGFTLKSKITASRPVCEPKKHFWPDTTSLPCQSLQHPVAQVPLALGEPEADIIMKALTLFSILYALFDTIPVTHGEAYSKKKGPYSEFGNYYMCEHKRKYCGSSISDLGTSTSSSLAVNPQAVPTVLPRINSYHSPKRKLLTASLLRLAPRRHPHRHRDGHIPSPTRRRLPFGGLERYPPRMRYHGLQ